MEPIMNIITFITTSLVNGNKTPRHQDAVIDFLVLGSLTVFKGQNRPLIEMEEPMEPLFVEQRCCCFFEHQIATTCSGFVINKI